MHLLLHDELLDELRALGGVRCVVEKTKIDLHLLSMHVDAARVIDLLDGELGGDLVRAADLRFLAGQRQDRADADLVVLSTRGDRNEQEEKGRLEESSPRSTHKKLSLPGRILLLIRPSSALRAPSWV